MDEAIILHELRNFLDESGRLTKYPSKFRLKLFSLYFFAGKLKPDVRYTESEINDIIREWHTFEDWAMLRRDMFDRGFLCRERDGSSYRLAETLPPLSKFGL